MTPSTTNTAALRSKQPAASEGDGCAMCSRWKALAESADLLRSVAEKRAARLEAHAGEAVAYAEAEYEFEVWQDDFVQAGGTAPTVEEVMTEAAYRKRHPSPQLPRTPPEGPRDRC